MLDTDQGWYQTIELEPGLTTHGCLYCGDPAWKNIQIFLPPSLKGMRILDLGCNAGIFCVRSALRGARECIGIDSNDWKEDTDYLRQARFVKEHFENYLGKQLPIRYIEGRMEEVLKRDLGKFDYCYAIASLYYTTDPEYVVQRISEISENVIVRLRDENRIRRFTELFEKFGYKMLASMQERWWEVLNIPTDDFYLYHYARK